MPTILKLFGLVFRIYTRDHLPPHVHVLSADGEAIFTISSQDAALKENKGLRQKDVNLVLSILEENRELILEEWNRIHNV